MEELARPVYHEDLADMDLADMDLFTMPYASNASQASVSAPTTPDLLIPSPQLALDHTPPHASPRGNPSVNLEQREQCQRVAATRGCRARPASPTPWPSEHGPSRTPLNLQRRPRPDPFCRPHPLERCPSSESTSPAGRKRFHANLSRRRRAKFERQARECLTLTTTLLLDVFQNPQKSLHSQSRRLAISGILRSAPQGPVEIDAYRWLRVLASLQSLPVTPRAACVDVSVV